MGFGSRLVMGFGTRLRALFVNQVFGLDRLV
jgi:hypothetical protein